MKPPRQAHFEKVYKDYSEAIFRFCYFRVRDREVAKDLTLETFTRTWKYLQEGKTINHWQAFLYQTASRLTMDHGSKQIKHPSLSLDSLTETTGFEAEDPHTALNIDHLDGSALVKKLLMEDNESAEILLMRFVDDLPVKDMAKMYNISENAMSVRIHRAIKKIKELHTNDETA